MSPNQQAERQWSQWISTLEAISEPDSRVHGVAGDWTVHDVANHVQSYARFHLVQVRGAMTGVAPAETEWLGDRVPWEGEDRGFEERNRNIQRAGLGLSRRQILDEAAWIRDGTLALFSSHDPEERVGWLLEPGPDDDPRLIVRRVRDVPGVVQQQPAWTFVLNAEHMTEHLEQIRAWLAARQPS